MKLVQIPEERLRTELSALVTVARLASGGMGEPQRAFINALQRVQFKADMDLDTLPAIDPEMVARQIDDPAEALQLVRLMVVTSLAAGPPNPDQVEVLSRFANALQVDEPAIGVIMPLSIGHVWRFRAAFFRHSHILYYIKKTYRLTGSLFKVLKAPLVFKGIIKGDGAESAQYRALGDLPDKSLGHAFYMHCIRSQLAFPGEKGGFPEGGLFHDFAHVLAGYDTSPEGEMQVAAFQAGFTTGKHDFFTWLFSIVIHTTGVNLLPFAVPLRPGRMGDGTIAPDVIDALRRGNAVARDLGTDWDYWSEVRTPLSEVRERLRIPPLAAPLGTNGKPKPGVVTDPNSPLMT